MSHVLSLVRGPSKLRVELLKGTGRGVGRGLGRGLGWDRWHSPGSSGDRVSGYPGNLFACPHTTVCWEGRFIPPPLPYLPFRKSALGEGKLRRLGSPEGDGGGQAMEQCWGWQVIRNVFPKISSVSGILK